MVEKIQTLLTLLGIISILAVVAERVRFPFPILLVIAGLLIALFPGLPEVGLDPEIVFLIFLPPLLFSAAWNFPWETFRSNLIPIFALAVGLVFATILCVACAAYWLIPGMTLASGFVLGAIVSPPDAVAATAVLRDLRVPKRLSAVLEGESLVNDASGLVAYQFAVAAVVTGSFSLVEAGADFVWMSVGGTVFGLLVGMGVAYLHRQLRGTSVAVTLTLLTPYISYLPAERFGFSGVLAVVATGLYIGHRSWEALGPESRLQRESIYASINEESDRLSGESDTLTAKCNPLEVLSRTEAIESIRRAVMSLPDHYREVVVLCELQEMSYEEAATIIGCALGTVRSRLHRARSLLIEKLQPSKETDEISQTVRTARCFA